MKFNVLEFNADIKNRIFYTLNIIYQYRYLLYLIRNSCNLIGRLYTNILDV